MFGDSSTKKKRVGCTSRHCHITVNDDTGGLSRSGALLRVLELLNSGSQWCFKSWCITDTTVGVYMFLL